MVDVNPDMKWYSAISDRKGLLPTGGVEADGGGVLISRGRKGHGETLRVGMDALLPNARVIFDAVEPERSGLVGLESSQDQLPRLESGDLNQNSDSRSWSHPDPVVGEVTADRKSTRLNSSHG